MLVLCLKITVIIAITCTPGIALNWQILEGFYGGQISSIVQNKGTLYAATTGGVYTSIDSGQTWTSTNQGILSKITISLTVSGEEVLCGANSGIYKFDLQNGAWVKLAPALITDPVNVLLTKGAIVYACTDTAVYISHNYGNTWKLSKSGGWPYYYTSVAHKGIAYLGTENTSGIFWSQDDGTTWNQIKGELFSEKAVYSLASAGDNLIAGTSNGVFLSADSGRIWTNTTGGAPSQKYIHALLAEENVVYAGGFGNKVYESNDYGVSWTDSISLPINTNVKSFLRMGQMLLVGTRDYGVWALNEKQKTWTQLSNGINAMRVDNINVEGDTILASVKHDIFLSLNAGKSWLNIFTDSTESGIMGVVINNNNLLFGNQKGIYRLENQNGKWKPDMIFWAHTFSLFAVDSNLLAGTEEGLYHFTPDPAEYGGYKGEKTLGYLSISAIGNNGDIVMAADRSGNIFESYDKGLTWDGYKTDVHDFNALLNIDDTLFATTWYGHFYTMEKDSTFYTANTYKNAYLVSVQELIFQNISAEKLGREGV